MDYVAADLRCFIGDLRYATPSALGYLRSGTFEARPR